MSHPYRKESKREGSLTIFWCSHHCCKYNPRDKWEPSKLGKCLLKKRNSERSGSDVNK